MDCNFKDMPALYARVYEALDASIAMQTCLPRSEATVQRALGQFRAEAADLEAIEQLQAISVRLQSLKIAAMSGDAPGRVTARNALSAAAGQWLERLPIH